MASVHETTFTAPAPAASDYFIEAKREVLLLARRGQMMSPRDAWLLAGQLEGQQTLWSVAYRMGVAHDVPPTEICAYLERQFPQYTNTQLRPLTWDDIHRRG